MIVILGLVILVAGVAGVLANGGHAYAVTHFAVFGYHLTGSAGTLPPPARCAGQPGTRHTAGAPGRPGRRSPSRRVVLILTCLTGIAGALLGGWAAMRIFHLHHALNGFFNLSTWLTAIAGAAILLLVWHLVTGQSGRSRRSSRFAHR